MSLNDVVLDVVREKGPLLPAEIVSEVSKKTGKQTDMFFMGAVLSELMTEKYVKMSHAKIGGSRLYYCQGQEERLSRVYDYLNSKEQKAYDLLKENKILRNSEQEPVMRVALFELKDFAKSIDVNLNGTERFWYWFSMPVEDVKSRIKDLLKDEISSPRAKEVVEETPLEKQDSSSKNSNSYQEKTANENREKNNRESSFIGNNNSSKEAKSIVGGEENHFIGSSQSVKKEPEEKEKKEQREQQSKLNTSLDTDDEFMKSVISFFESKDISVLEGALLKKKSDCEFQVNVKSQVGKLRFYVYAKSKKKVTETDLGYAYVRSQNVHLPLCFISNGELTKKASDFLENELNSATFLRM